MLISKDYASYVRGLGEAVCKSFDLDIGGALDEQRDVLREKIKGVRRSLDEAGQIVARDDKL